MNIAGHIENAARETPKAVAIVYGERETSYAELDKTVNRMANGLRRLGISEGDRVGIMLPNIPEFIYAFYGCLKIGAIAVPFNTMYKSKELLHILRDSGARAVVCLTNFVPLVEAVREQLPSLEHIITTGERTVTFADPSSTAFVQAVLGKDVFSDPDDAYRRAGAALAEGLRKLGVADIRYVHRGALVVNDRKIAGFTVAAVEDLYVINAICFLARFDPSDFLTAIWVPPEVKDKMVEPLTSLAEIRGTAPSPAEFRTAMVEALSAGTGVLLEAGELTREEKFAYQKQRSLLLRAAPKDRREHRSGSSASGGFAGWLRRLFGGAAKT